jgi:hypothetical protein
MKEYGELGVCHWCGLARRLESEILVNRLKHPLCDDCYARFTRMAKVRTRRPKTDISQMQMQMFLFFSSAPDKCADRHFRPVLEVTDLQSDGQWEDNVGSLRNRSAK